jgi:hypothetical protein
MCRKDFARKSTKISVSVFPRLFCFIEFLGLSQRWEFKDTKKTFCKRILSKSVYKKIDKNTQNRFFSRFVSSRFWAFPGEVLFRSSSLTADGHQAALQGQQVLLARARHCTTPRS